MSQYYQKDGGGGVMASMTTRVQREGESVERQLLVGFVFLEEKKQQYTAKHRFQDDGQKRERKTFG